MTSNQMGIFARRRIEAEIIKPIYDILRRDLGQAGAEKIIEEAITQHATTSAQQFAQSEGNGGGLQGFIALQPLWTKDSALEVEVLNQTADEYNYNVTHCRYAQMYQEMGLGEIAHLLSCIRDRVFIEGYAPEVKLTRTQTIAGGAPYCDFRYKVSK